MTAAKPNLKICFLSSMHPPTDKRVFYKEARTLVDAGYRVCHLAPSDAASASLDGVPTVLDGVELLTYKAGRTLWARVSAMWKLYVRAAAVDADVYHCNEVDSWIVGIWLKIFRRRCVVFDVHEHYPSTFGRLHCPKALASLAGSALRAMFRLLIPVTDAFVFAKETVVRDFPLTAHKSVVVRNFAAVREPVPHRTSNHGDRVTAIHLGVFGRIRGWPQLLAAMQLVKCPYLFVQVIGTVNDGSAEDFRQAISQEGLRDRVTIEDWMPFEEAFERVVNADIGLVLFQPGVENHVFAMPHKMFDYMIAGLAVIIPDFAVEVAPIVAKERCGILVDPSHPQEIANALDTLAMNPRLRQEYGDNGRRAVLREYNWQSEGKRLVALYQKLHNRVARSHARRSAREVGSSTA